MDDLIIKRKNDFQNKLSKSVKYNVKKYNEKINNIIKKLQEEKSIKIKYVKHI